MAHVKLTYLGDILKLHPQWIPDFNKSCLTRDFVDTKRFSPVVYNADEAMPERDHPEYEAWWIEQYRRCIKGYVVPKATRRGHTIWIPGRMYFYLNFWIIFAKLDDSDRKEKRNPKFTSLDYFKFMVLEMMFYFKKDNIFPKSRQKGFELPDSEPVLTIDGWKNNGDLKIGDLVATKKGTYTPILEIFPQGIKDVYEIEFSDGRKVRCGYNHKWLVRDKTIRRHNRHERTINRDEWKVIYTHELLDGKHEYTESKYTGNRYVIPNIKPVVFDEKELPINPYLLGCLIGDGYTHKQLKISSKDQELIDRISNILGTDYQLRFDKDSNCNYTIGYYGKHLKEMKERYGLKSHINKFNPLKQELRLLGLIGKHSYSKFIPELYKNSSIEQRIELLRGLFDTDGSINEFGDIEYKTVSEELANDIAYILRSLGCVAKVSKFSSKQGYRNYFRVYVKSTDINLFYIQRKLERFNKNKKPYDVSIVGIKKLDYKESSTCIMVEDSEHIYLTKDFVPTHNSEYGAANIAYNFIFLPSSVSVIVAGQGDYAEKTMQNVITGLNNLGDSEFYKRRKPDRADYIKATYTEQWEDEETGEKRTLYKGYGSEVYCITAKDNTQAVSRLSPFFVLYEEIGKWKKGTLTETSEFVKPSLFAEGVKTGWQMYIGTGGDMDESVADVQKMSYNPASFGLLEFDNIWEENNFRGAEKVGAFVPSYEFEIIDSDGNSLIEESIAAINADLSTKNATERYRAITQKPFYLSQMFMITSGSFLGETAMQKLNDRKRWILNNKDEQIAFNARLDWVDPFDWSKGVVCNPDEEGRFVIQQRPEKDARGDVWVNLYNAATDSYDKDESNSSSSQGSCTIFKKVLDSSHTYKHWVARVTERPTEEEGGSYAFYEDTIKLCLYYGECQNLIEYSNVLIFDYYKRRGYEFLLKERPAMVISQYVKDGQASQRYGIEQSFIPHALNMWRDFIKQDDYAVIEKMYDLEMIEAFAKFRKDKNYNCDITISCALNVASDIEDQEIAVYSQSDEDEEGDYGAYVEDNDGNIKYQIAG